MSHKDRQGVVRNSGGASDEPAFSEDGVDVTLIRWMLSLTPTERLEVLQEYIWSIMRLRGEDAET
jgi:hypothetical protein